MFSRPVPYPFDWDCWLVANINDTPATGTVAANAGNIDTKQQKEPVLKTEAEINAMTKKSDVIDYAVSIGLNGLSAEQRLDDLKTAVLNYQEEHYNTL